MSLKQKTSYYQRCSTLTNALVSSALSIYGTFFLKWDEGKNYFNDEDIQLRPRWVHFQACISFVAFLIVDGVNILRGVKLAEVNAVQKQILFHHAYLAAAYFAAVLSADETEGFVTVIGTSLLCTELTSISWTVRFMLPFYGYQPLSFADKYNATGTFLLMFILRMVYLPLNVLKVFVPWYIAKIYGPELMLPKMLYSMAALAIFLNTL